MANLRKEARGQPCFIRLPGCSGGGEDTVACHYRMAGYNGVGLKPPDALIAFGCWQCHEYVDFRQTLDGWTRDEIRLAHAEGCLRTAVERGR